VSVDSSTGEESVLQEFYMDKALPMFFTIILSHTDFIMTQRNLVCLILQNSLSILQKGRNDDMWKSRLQNLRAEMESWKAEAQHLKSLLNSSWQQTASHGCPQISVMTGNAPPQKQKAKLPVSALAASTPRGHM
jgi:hypothetical protein